MFFSHYTLGCKTNQAESDAIASLLESRGHVRVPWGEYADALIINTCSVTAVADKKSRGVIRRARRAAPDAVLAIHGCMAQGGNLGDLEADVLGGTSNRTGFALEVERAVSGRKKESPCDSVPVDAPCESAAVTPAHEVFEALPAASGQRTRAFLKLQDGCDGVCAYCIIPSLRGRSRSLGVSGVLAAADALAANALEIVLTGIEISAYRDGDTGLAGIVSLLAERHPETRFRLGSLAPQSVNASFAEALAAHKNICPHFHLSLQSGCDSTLASMRRPYTTASVSEACGLLRDRFPNCTLGCDLIVGFPGETDADFEASLSFIESAGFAFTHIFPYSKRPGTPAASMDGQLTRAQKQARAAQAAALARRLTERAASECVGRTLEVLFETGEQGAYCQGHAGNYFVVRTPAPGLHGQMRRITVTGTDGEFLLGIPASPD